MVCLLSERPFPSRAGAQGEISVRFFSEPRSAPVPAPNLPQLSNPAADAVASLPGADADTSILSLPPRPDPLKMNPAPHLPSLPAFAAQSGRHLVVILRVFVLEDGRIGDTSVSGSSGYRELDELARKFVRANWQFLPALSSGHPVRDWTTVEVQFADAPPPLASNSEHPGAPR